LENRVRQFFLFGEYSPVSKVLLINGQGQLVADTFNGLAPEGFEIAWISSNVSDAEKVEQLRDVHYVVLHPASLSGATLKEAKSLRLVQLLAAGYEKVDLRAAAELGIPVATNGGANAWAVAEHTIALILALYKRIVLCDLSVRAGEWRKSANGFNTFELAGKTVGIIGAGNIGRKLAYRLKAFETNILYYDALTVPEIDEKLGARRVSLDELVLQSDIITLHAPLLKETSGLLGAKQFAMMKPSTILINTSRAELVDESTLISALREKTIAGAGIDVYYHEPVPTDHPLLRLDNVVLTPHTAGHALEGWARRCRFAWENIQRVARGERPTFTVRLE
jgi:phosphoglycerate dehydrogenase-like enzyme